jgi:hypothetical protein
MKQIAGLIFRLRYVARMRQRGVDYGTAWYCSGVSLAEYGFDQSPRDAADEELSCWTD